MQANPVIETITRSYGLPTKQVHSVCYANDFIWAATSNGLARFDGERIDVFSQKHGLLTHGLRSLSVVKDYLLVCSDLGLDILCLKTNTILKSVNTVQLGAGWCQCAQASDADVIYLGCAKGLLSFCVKTSSIESIMTVPRSPVTHLSRLPSDERLFGVSSHTQCWILDPMSNQADMLDKRSYPVQQLSSGYNSYWLVEKHRLLELDCEGDILRKFTMFHSKADNIKVLPIDGNKLLIADQNGIAKVEIIEQKLQVLEKWPVNSLINDFAVDSIGNIWVATDYAGLKKIPVLQRYVERVSCIEQMTCLCVSQNATSGNTFYAGVASSYVEHCSSMRQIKAFKGHTCWDIQEDERGNIWGASNDGLLCSSDVLAKKATCYSHADCGFGRCLYFSQRGVYLGTTCGLFLFDYKLQKLLPVLNQNQQTISYVYTIRKLGGTVFVTTLGNGVWVLAADNAIIERYEVKGLGMNVYDMDINDKAELLIAHGNRISCIANNSIRHIYESSDSVAAWSCRWFSHHQLILGTSEGLKVLNRDSGYCQFSFEKFPNNIFWEFTTSRSLLLSQQACLCGINDGAYRVDLSKLIASVEAPIPEVLQLECTTEFVNRQSGIAIEQGNWQLAITLSCKWYWLDNSIRYEYRLRGFDKNWLSLDSRTINLTSLPPGEYGLEVRVSNGLTQTDTRYPLLLVKVKPTNLWLKVIFGLLNQVKSAVSYVMRIGDAWAIETRYKRLEQLVNRRTNELAKANTQLSLANKKLQSLSETDQLTQLDNRHAFINKFNQALSHAIREKHPISLLMIDIDSFKTYNDNYGHIEGDLCLKEVANCLRHQVKRATDLIARFGGEEFIIALPNSDLNYAVRFAQQCVKAVRDCELPHAFSPALDVVTISVGVACMTPDKKLKHEEFEQFRKLLTEQADEHLYQAKLGGRNRVVAQ